MSKSADDGLVARNRRAHFDYEITDTYEAGLQLTGTEVKSLRGGHANIAEAYVSPERGGLWLINSDFPPYEAGNRFNHEPRRHRKLLLHKREIAKLTGAVQREGRTIIPLRLYFNARGLAKLQIGLAKGKKTIDKREDKKQRDWNRAKQRLLKDFG